MKCEWKGKRVCGNIKERNEENTKEPKTEAGMNVKERKTNDKLIQFEELFPLQH